MSEPFDYGPDGPQSDADWADFLDAEADRHEAQAAQLRRLAERRRRLAGFDERTFPQVVEASHV